MRLTKYNRPPLTHDATPKTADYTAAVGAMNEIDLSGAVANLVVDPPANPKVGDAFGYRVTTAHANHTYGVRINTATNVNGFLATDLFWSLWAIKEQLVLVWNGTFWLSLDGRIPHVCRMRKITNQVDIPITTFTTLTYGATDQDNCSVATPGSGLISPRRPGIWNVSSGTNFEPNATGNERVVWHISQFGQFNYERHPNSATGYKEMNVSGDTPFAAWSPGSVEIFAQAYHDASTPIDVIGGGQYYNFLAGHEVLF